MQQHAISLAVLGTLALTGTARAGTVMEYDFFDDWQTAAGDYETLTFQDIPDDTFVTEEYADLGVHFTGGWNQIFFTPAFVNDGVGIFTDHTVAPMVLKFDQPITSIAAHFPGFAQFVFKRDGQVVGESLILGFGGLGQFGGILSSEPFDEVIISDPADGHPFIDDIHFGSPIPAPAALPVLALGLLIRTRRRG